MYENVELVETNKLKNPDLKITRTGKFLRKYSIDEFPQFLSVII
jgi:lipopolysaccharide/colanic/teichoic acid biosynthesis glycosyltransferase